MKLLHILLCSFIFFTCSDHKSFKIEMDRDRYLAYYKQYLNFLNPNKSQLDSLITYEVKAKNKTFFIESTIEKEIPLVVKMRSGAVKTPHAVRIGIIDYNNNGIFNEAGLDKNFFPQTEKDTLDPDLCLSWTFDYYQNIKFSLDQNNYTIHEIDPNGNYIEVSYLPEKNDLVPDINIVSNIYLLNFDNNQTTINHLKNDFKDAKFSLIKMWFIGCSGCTKQIPKIKELRKRYGIAVAGFNAVDSEYILKRHSEEHNIPWNQYKVEKELLKSLGNDCMYPYNILVNKYGDILMRAIKIEEIENYLQKQFGS